MERGLSSEGCILPSRVPRPKSKKSRLANRFRNATLYINRKCNAELVCGYAAFSLKYAQPITAAVRFNKKGWARSGQYRRCRRTGQGSSQRYNTIVDAYGLVARKISACFRERDRRPLMTAALSGSR
jgi:hypothetical protein